MDYHKPLQGSLLTNQYFMESKGPRVFECGSNVGRYTPNGPPMDPVRTSSSGTLEKENQNPRMGKVDEALSVRIWVRV